MSEALRSAVVHLTGASDSPRADAEILLAHVLGCGRAALLARGDDPLPAERFAEYGQLLVRRRAGEPVAYLTGRKEFWSLSLAVTPDVLIPRPETELLVEWGLQLVLAPRPSPASGGGGERSERVGALILDLGTGSGAIALALAKECPAAEIMATDISAAALEEARGNANRLDIRNVSFHDADFFRTLDAGVRRHDGAPGFDLIVSNPPYVAEGDPHLASLRFEPAQALVAGSDGLEALRAIIEQAPRYLAPCGWLLLEHGATQGAAVRGLMREAGLTDIETRRDLAGHERATAGQRP